MDIELSGVVDRVIFSANDNNFCVFKLKTKERLQAIVCAGNIPTPPVGDEVCVHGAWTQHPRFGQQLRVSTLERILPSSESGMIRFLSSDLFPGIGPATAKRIVHRFGLDTLRILEEEPNRLFEVKGIGRKTLEKMLDAYRESGELRDLTLHLEQAGVSTTFIPALRKAYGENALHVLQTTPYRLVREIDGLGFRTADKLAQFAGISPQDEARLEAGFEFVLWQASREGHVCLPQPTLAGQTAQLLAVDQEYTAAHLAALVEAGVFPAELGRDGMYIYHPQLYQAEVGTVERIHDLMCFAPPPLPASRLVLDKLAGETGWELATNQLAAVEAALQHGVSVITGGPGTGKTTIILAILRCLQDADCKVLLTAPTGRAAKRLSEATGTEANTIHKLLEAGLQGQVSLFQRDADNPLEADAVIVDEASMIDIQLMYHLLDALAPRTRLILVGDADQLPSVGPGNVLRDLIRAEVIPVTALHTVFRQEEGSDIALAAQAIREGRMPVFDPDSDLVLYERTEEQGLEMVLRICERLGYDREENLYRIQVLAPMYRGICGADNLNLALQQRFRARETDKEQKFVVGDKVMQKQNDYEKGVYNGDLGRVYAQTSQSILVDFQIKNVTYEGEERAALQPAYAMTVHKSQGSEYESVIIVMMDSHYPMLQRNLFYTALTRAKCKVYVVGNENAVRQAIRNQRTQNRCSLLYMRLTGEMDR